ncbi:MAG: hypothetical protein ABIZ91_10340 [Gemmatimonadaceae bacterium]
MTLSRIFFVLAAATCALAQVAVVRAALAGRTPGASNSVVGRVRELVWVLLPACLLLLALVWTWRSLPAGDDLSASAPSATTPVISTPVRGPAIVPGATP